MADPTPPDPPVIDTTPGTLPDLPTAPFAAFLLKLLSERGYEATKDVASSSFPLVPLEFADLNFADFARAMATFSTARAGLSGAQLTASELGSTIVALSIVATMIGHYNMIPMVPFDDSFGASKLDAKESWTVSAPFGGIPSELDPTGRLILRELRAVLRQLHDVPTAPEKGVLYQPSGGVAIDVGKEIGIDAQAAQIARIAPAAIAAIAWPVAIGASLIAGAYFAKEAYVEGQKAFANVEVSRQTIEVTTAAMLTMRRWEIKIREGKDVAASPLEEAIAKRAETSGAADKASNLSLLEGGLVALGTLGVAGLGVWLYERHQKKKSATRTTTEAA